MTGILYDLRGNYVARFEVAPTGNKPALPMFVSVGPQPSHSYQEYRVFKHADDPAPYGGPRYDEIEVQLTGELVYPSAGGEKT